MDLKESISRRDFIKAAAFAGGTLHAFDILGAENKSRAFKVALVGCGGRGQGALENCIEAGKFLGVEIQPVAAADAFLEKALSVGKARGIPEERCFGGFDGYRKAIDTEAEVVIMATPPNFRPLHLETSIAAGKHVFMEKPVAVDPPGARRVIAAGELAKTKGLGIVAGTQRRHEKGYLANQFAVSKGAIGRIVGGTLMWCGGKLWFKTKEANEDDASYMVRNWVSFTEMSGDHIVEQHVHNIDVANWFIGHPPVTAIGFGGRARRKTGDQFDFFSVDYDYGEGCHIHSMCRQIDGTYGRVAEFFIGTKGTTPGSGKMTPETPVDFEIPEFSGHDNAYVNEHVALLDSIIKGTPLNEAQTVAEATLAGIMGRMSAYTGQLIRWVDAMDSNVTLKPTAEDFELGPVQAPADDVAAIPGKGDA